MVTATAEKLTATETSTIESMAKLKSQSVAKFSKISATALGYAKFGWHAWLGAAITLEEKTVATLGSFATKGAAFESKAKEKMLKTKSQVTSQVTSQTSDFRSKAQSTLGDVETMLDKGVNKSLHILGVPTKHDMQELTSLMKDMSDAIGALASQSAIAADKTKKSFKSATADMN